MLDQKKKSGILVPSKLPMTSGIILMALLIFIASFALFLLLLVMLAKRKRQICRMIMTNKEQAAGKRKEENGEEKSAATFPSAGNPTTRPSCFQLRSSAIEKSASTVFLPCGLSYSSHSPTSSQHPLYPMGNQDLNLSLGRFYGKKHVGSGSGCGSEDGAASCFDLTPSETTTFTVISNQNDFPPPPTSIISTASTSHGYGSIEEDEDEEGIPGSNWLTDLYLTATKELSFSAETKYMLILSTHLVQMWKGHFPYRYRVWDVRVCYKCYVDRWTLLPGHKNNGNCPVSI